MSEEVSQGAVSAPGFIGGLLVVLSVIGQVAALTQGAKVGRVAVLRRVVKVGDGQHDTAVGDGMRLVIHCAAKLASVAGPFQHRGADGFPVFWIAMPVFRLDGHGQNSKVD